MGIRKQNKWTNITGQKQTYWNRKFWGCLRGRCWCKGLKKEGIKWCNVYVQLLSCVQFLVILWTLACQAALWWNFPSFNIGVSCHFLLQGNLPTTGVTPTSPSPALQVDCLPLSHQGSSRGASSHLWSKSWRCNVAA